MIITAKRDVITIGGLLAEIRKSDDREMAFNIPEMGLNHSGLLPDFRAAKKKLIDRFEKTYVKKLLEKNDWNISKCAREIQMHRNSFQRLVRKCGLSRGK